MKEDNQNQRNPNQSQIDDKDKNHQSGEIRKGSEKLGEKSDNQAFKDQNEQNKQGLKQDPNKDSKDNKDNKNF